MSKKQIEILEKEKNMLKITLSHYATENENLKNMLEDFKITVKHNKEMLKEYVDNITNKDSTVQKMGNLIEQLNERLNSANEQIKKLTNEKGKKIENSSPIKKFDKSCINSVNNYLHSVNRSDINDNNNSANISSYHNNITCLLNLYPNKNLRLKKECSPNKNKEGVI